MSIHKRVVWYEGMHLDPHHFQHADRFYESLLSFQRGVMTRNHWGFLELAIDEGALRNGQFKLKTCRGLMPDGLAFDLAENGEALPASVTIDNKTFPPEKRKLGVWLVVPGESERESNYLLPGAETSRETRFVADKLQSRDATTGDNPIDLFVGRAQMRIHLGDKTPDGYTAMKMAELVNEGAVALNRQFIPPCLAVQASNNLHALTASLLEKLITKRNALWEQRRHPSQPGPFMVADAFIWGRLEVVNTSIPLLRHCSEVENCHPEKLYALLLALAGQFTTYAVNVDTHPTDLPAYNHFELWSCFNQVRQTIELLLDDEIKQRFFPIALEKQDRPQHALLYGKLDESLLHAAQFYFLVSSDRYEVPDQLEKLSGHFKIASKKDIVNVVQYKLPGIGVKSVSPAVVGKRENQSGLKCLQIVKAGELWDKLTTEPDIVIWVGGELKEFKFELIAVKER
jgi:type VI secretion system protein ImpJ